MKPETLLYDLQEFGENYSKMTTSEIQQLTLDIINDMLSTQNLKQVLIDARSVIYHDRFSKGQCPLCSTELDFVKESVDKLEAWGKSVQMETKIAICPNCDWRHNT